MKEMLSSSCLAGNRTSEELNQQYHYFVSKISHEIRNPLTLIYSSLQLVEKKHPELPGTELWGQLKQEVEETITLLNELSSYNNSSDLKPELIRPSAFLTSIDTACRPSMEAKGIQFDTYTLNKIPPMYADSLKLKQALLNLLRNAQDAVAEQKNMFSSPSRSYRSHGSSCHSSGCEKRIELYAEYTGFFINFHVRDNGPGIPDEYMDTLFDPFVTHKRTGTGLGLSIVKNIADTHGGSLTLLTNCCPPDTFTDFCLSIPVDS